MPEPKEISCYIFVARSDARFIRQTIPALCQMVRKANCKPRIILDSNFPGGVLGGTLAQADLEKILKILKELQENSHFDIEILRPKSRKVKELSKIHFGKLYAETHCFRGYPIHGSIWQFHQDESEYILHLDCDMLFYEDKGFSWIKSAIKLMEENEDIVCTLPRGGPPTDDGELKQGNTYYKKDDSRGLYLFKNFTSRHYLVHRERFLRLLPMKPLWLSWREPFKSAIFGNGKMLCWESMVEKALERTSLWRADLMTNKAWSLHPGERSKEFYKKLPSITKQVAKGHFPAAQAGHFDLRLGDWEVNQTL